MHYAVAGQTAAELVNSRADKSKEYAGLTIWKCSPDGKILKSDGTMAKNYLNENELGDLRLAVTAFLDIAESRAQRRIPISIRYLWVGAMVGYLELNEYSKLKDAGNMTTKAAEAKVIK